MPSTLVTPRCLSPRRSHPVVHTPPLITQVGRDARFLRDWRIMDYSLLVGIQNVTERRVFHPAPQPFGSDGFEPTIPAHVFDDRVAMSAAGMQSAHNGAAAGGRQEDGGRGVCIPFIDCGSVFFG